MSVGEAPLPGSVHQRAVVALRQVAAAGDVAQAMLHLQSAVEEVQRGQVRLRTGSALMRLARRAAQRAVEASDGEAVRGVFRRR